MARVEAYESTEEEVMLNRLRLRNYIRELILNQQRVMEKIAANAEGGGDAAVQNMVNQMQAASAPSEAETAVSETASVSASVSATFESRAKDDDED